MKSQLNVVLVEPEIPPNTGNIARLCAAVGVRLHLVGPLGFTISDKHLRRAGLDYWHLVDLQVHDSLQDFLDLFPGVHLMLFSSKAQRAYVEARFQGDEYLVFGSETRGLPDWFKSGHQGSLFRIPIFNSGVRSLNLSSAVAIVVYEALRQTGGLS